MGMVPVPAQRAVVTIAVVPEVAGIEGGIEIQHCNGKPGEPGHDEWITLGTDPIVTPEYYSGALGLDGKDDVGIGRYSRTKARGLIP